MISAHPAHQARMVSSVEITDISAQGWSLNPGRYVGVATGEDFGGDKTHRGAVPRQRFDRDRRSTCPAPAPPGVFGG